MFTCIYKFFLITPCVAISQIKCFAYSIATSLKDFQEFVYLLIIVFFCFISHSERRFYFYFLAFKGTTRITINMYLVVEFLDTKDMAVVPKSWCIGTDSQQLTVSWPPHRDPCKLNKLVRDNAVPISQWNQYIARRIASSGMYMDFFKVLENIILQHRHKIIIIFAGLVCDQSGIVCYV